MNSGACGAHPVNVSVFASVISLGTTPTRNIPVGMKDKGRLT